MTFEELQRATAERGELWGSPGLQFRFIELAGESGECCEAGKKYLRYKLGMKGGNADIGDIADEIADVVIAASALASELDLDLGEIVARKFNKTSKKYGFPQQL